MPKSKRVKVVSLSKTKQDRKTLKHDLVESVQENVDKFKYVYVFAYENMRSNYFKDLRAQWSESRFLMGKNRVIQIALNAGDANEGYRPGLSNISEDLVGNVGLLFSDRAPAEVKKFMSTYSTPDYARAGYVPTETLTIPQGPLPTDTFPHSQAELLKSLGVPIRLDKGTIIVTQEHTICNKDYAITPEQGRLLKLFGHQLAVFRLSLVSVWTAESSEYKRLATGAKITSSNAKAAVKNAVKTKMNNGRNNLKSTFAKGAGGGGADDDEEEEEDEDDDEEEMDDE